jgi:hypothetical protein
MYDQKMPSAWLRTEHRLVGCAQAEKDDDTRPFDIIYSLDQTVAGLGSAALATANKTLPKHVYFRKNK